MDPPRRAHDIDSLLHPVQDSGDSGEPAWEVKGTAPSNHGHSGTPTAQRSTMPLWSLSSVNALLFSRPRGG